MPILTHNTLFSAQAVRWRGWQQATCLVGMVLIVASNLFGSWLLHRLGLLDDDWTPISITALIVYLVLPFGLLWLLIGAWVRGVERRPLASIGLGGRQRGRDFAAGYAVGLLGMAGIVLAIALAGGYRVLTLGAAFASPEAVFGIVCLIAGFALQSSAEELLFRGWLLAVPATRGRLLLAVALSSALFTLLHYGFGQALLVTVNNALFALFCCAWVIKTGQLFGVMGWHSAWNWLNAVGFEQALTGMDVGIPALIVALERTGPAWLNGGSEGPEGSVFCTLFFIGGLLWLLRPERRPQAHNKRAVQP